MNITQNVVNGPQAHILARLPYLSNAKNTDRVAVLLKKVEFFCNNQSEVKPYAELYHSLTVHYTDKNLNLKACCLQASYFSDTWDLQEENIYITTDNASNDDGSTVK